MKKLLALLLALMTILTTLPALAADVEPNTMVAKIDGELVTFYLKYAIDEQTVFFVTYDEQGRENRQFRPVIRKNTGTGTYEGFNSKNISEMYFNVLTYDKYGNSKIDTQYLGGDFSKSTFVGGNADAHNRMKNNKSDIVLKLTKATGSRFVGEFSAMLHDVTRDELIPIQGKFDYTIGEKYEGPTKPSVDYGLSLDDIDF